jgi:hypothetical protein
VGIVGIPQQHLVTTVAVVINECLSLNEILKELSSVYLKGTKQKLSCININCMPTISFFPPHSHAAVSIIIRHEHCVTHPQTQLNNNGI